ncbi:MAG: CoA-binding domain protein, partial [Gemmatimonadetes bacterium]|nr:CoA-binding domain protein [Gemmatimonadota bacterium]
MYVESFGNPTRFLEIASRVTRKKPIIVVKSGRSRVGARAASSHTGALAASDTAVDALLRQAGVLRAGSVEALFDLAMGFVGQSPPRSRRTAVLTNAGGPGILAVDAMEPWNLELPELSPATVERLRPLFPPEASIRNPLDMIASANPAGYRKALDALLDDPALDSAVAIFVPIPPNDPVEVTDAIVASASTHPEKPIFAVVMGHQGLPRGRAELQEVGIPAYLFPESAVRALAARVRHEEWRQRPVSALETLPVDREAAQRLLREAAAEGRTRLQEDDALDLLWAYGIPVARAPLATTRDAAVEAAERAGYPVVLKVVAPAIIHKTEAHGVQVDLRSADEVRAAYDRIMAGAAAAAPGATVEGVVVQRMVKGG